MGKGKVTILCSGFGLGFYIPGLLLEYQLNNRNAAAEVVVFENYIEPEKKRKINDSRKTYHHNFSAAQLATRIPSDIRNSLDEDKMDALIDEWKREKRQHFIVLSGHWVYILDILREQTDYPLHIHLLYVDSDRSPSWSNLLKYNPDYVKNYQELWLYEASTQQLHYRIDVTEEDVIPYRERPERFVIHGGGWGMGSYQGKIPELEQQGIPLDIVAYEAGETDVMKPENRYFMNDPTWNAWDKGANGKHQMPPFSEIKPGEAPKFASKLENHRLYDVLKSAKGIISKPGAGTLMDSLSSATPVIILEPFGKHEQKNAELWLSHGLGIRYEDWKNSGYALKELEAVHERLMAKKQSCPSYVDYFMEVL